MAKALYQHFSSNVTLQGMDNSSLSDPRNAAILAIVTLLAMVFVVPLVDLIILPWLLERRLQIARRRLRALRADLEAAATSEGNLSRGFAHATRLSTSEPPPGSRVADYELPQIPPLAHSDSILAAMPLQAMPVAHLPRAIVPVDDGETTPAISPTYVPFAAAAHTPSASPAHAPDGDPQAIPYQ